MRHKNLERSQGRSSQRRDLHDQVSLGAALWLLLAVGRWCGGLAERGEG